MLVLASASPRRRELLTQAGFTFQVHPADIPEDPIPNEDPVAYVTRLAREKAQFVFRQLVEDSMNPLRANSERLAAPQVLGAPSFRLFSGERVGCHEPDGAQARLAPPQVVLGADTTVTLDNAILGKPSDAADAARMLRLLSGRTHRVITGVALVTAESTRVAAEVTTVEFLELSDRDIAAYIATGEPMDKAGAYAIQGRAARWIPRIEGDYFNVVGLPIALVSALLESRPLR
jgi:septum formation protein